MAKKLWGGRFDKKTDPLVEDFTKSIDYDSKLAECDVIGSEIHVSVLKESGFITPKEAAGLTRALQKIHKKISSGIFRPDEDAEDIHTNIQNILEKEEPLAALKLHTARSRNDQVLFDLKVFCQLELIRTGILCYKLQKSLLGVCYKNKDTIIPGYTHLQHAQLIMLSDYLKGYVEMLRRDGQRIRNIENAMQLSLGAGALCGTPIRAELYKNAIKKFFKKDRELRTAFGGRHNIATATSVDTVSNRDFVIETLSALAILGMHLSRLAEDLVIWSTKEFGFMEMDDAFATGSSLMPQKKNPDVLELIRGYTGTLYGNLMSVLAMMKGLPLAYNRDMQLDKPPLFSSFEIITKELRVLAALIGKIKWNKRAIKNRIEEDESLYATDLVYHLIKKGIPFRKAHEIAGKLVKYSLDTGKKIKDMTDRELGRFSDKLKHGTVVKLMDPLVSVKSRISVKRSKD